MELFNTDNPIWGTLTAIFIAVQYIACYVGVLAYLRTVYGVEAKLSNPFTLFALFGIPLGPLLLDVLMFLEPLTILWILPNTQTFDQLRYLLPAYRATRVLIEVTNPSPPQPPAPLPSPSPSR